MSATPNEAHDASEDRVTEITKDEEEHEARASHTADRPPDPEEDEAAEEAALDPSVAEHEHEMGRIGAEVKGEGDIC